LKTPFGFLAFHLAEIVEFFLFFPHPSPPLKEKKKKRKEKRTTCPY